MVPNGWEVRTFGELFSIKSGFGFKYSEYAEKGIPLIKIDNVSHGYVKWDNVSYLPISYKDEYSDLLLQEGDLLLALNRPITQGKLKLVKLTKNDVPSILYQRVGRIDFIHKDLEKDFYLYLLDTEVFKFVSQKAIGSDQPFISTTELKKLNIIKPPLPEQRKIAKILSTWDRGIATTEKLIDASKQQKKALMQQLLTGKKRLVNPETGKAFEGEWKFSQFNELYKVANNKATQVKSGEYLESGRTPIVDQGKSIVGGYTNNEITYKDLPVIVFGDHTRIVKWVDFEFAQGADGTQVLKSHKSMDDKFAYYVLLNTDITNLGYSRHMRELKERDFKYPISKVEQQKIASVLTAADEEIKLLEAKLAHLKQEKKALMQQLLTGKRRVSLSS
ncbi:Type I restriction-modification system, specificity subunit S [Vibrio aestuarianus]|nr:Type I restriction-modification system, specificity subunit S [Vibrio aestuarianus]